MSDGLIFLLGAGCGAGLMFWLLACISALVVSGRIADRERDRL